MKERLGQKNGKTIIGYENESKIFAISFLSFTDHLTFIIPYNF